MKRIYWLAPLAAALVGTVALGVRFTGTPRQAHDVGPGNRGMADRLEAVAAAANPEINTYLNTRRVSLFRKFLAQRARTGRELELRLMLGRELLRAGRTEQAMEQLPAGPYKMDIPLSLQPPVGEAYSRIESPKGELGFYLVSDGGPAPYRFHVRSPSLINLSALKEMVVGSTVSDAVVTLGSIDINVGEVDR